jgi:hypothetical protein
MIERLRRAEPRFDVDLKWGQEAERKIRRFFKCLASDDPRVEVKRKSYLDLKFYIETHCDKGRTGCYSLSGINVTTAELWAFELEETGLFILIPTRLVREAIEEPSTVDREEKDGNCPTRGKLIDFAVLLHRIKQRRTVKSDDHVRRVTPQCIHRPEFIEDGRCWICGNI